MRFLKLLSRTLHVSMLLCLCLPFLKGCDGCGPTKEELANLAKAQMDSIAAVQAAAEQMDTTIQLSEEHIETKDFDSTLFEPLPEEHTFSERFMSAILQPNGDFSGLALIVIGIRLFAPALLTLLLFAILVIVSFGITFSKKNNFKWPVVLSAIELVCLTVFGAIFYSSHLLYGYWITAVLCTLNLLILIFIRKKSRSGFLHKKSAP